MAGQPPVAPSTLGRKSTTSTWKKFPLDGKALSSMKIEETIQKDPTNIEVIVERLLDSMVSEEETADYQR